MYSEYKNKILDFYNSNKRMPVYSEIMKLLNFKSKNAVYKLINKLMDDGVLKKDSNGRLSPLISASEIPVLGLVEAGIPTLSEENVLDTLDIRDYLVKEPNSTYLLEVKGDSMIDAGIQEGDLVVAERRNTARDGDIVIAEIDGGWTMKYYRVGPKGVYLEPANKDYDNIYPTYDLKISAIVRGVIRKY
jgi:repressor LexA